MSTQKNGSQILGSIAIVFALAGGTTLLPLPGALTSTAHAQFSGNIDPIPVRRAQNQDHRGRPQTQDHRPCTRANRVNCNRGGHSGYGRPRVDNSTPPPVTRSSNNNTPPVIRSTVAQPSPSNRPKKR